MQQEYTPIYFCRKSWQFKDKRGKEVVVIHDRYVLKGHDIKKRYHERFYFSERRFA